MTPSLPTFSDRSLQRRFQRDGFACVALADQSIPELVLRLVDEVGALDREGAWSSLHTDADARRAMVDRRLRMILWTELERYLLDHRPLIASLSIKAPTGATAFPVHQDWTTVDESRALGITCWIPATPIGKEEGLIRVVPGSHRTVDALRGSPHFPTPFDDARVEIERDHMVDVEVPLGHALIMAGRTLHMSGANRSGAPRIAVTISAIPSSQQAIHYFRSPDGTVEGFEVEPKFFRSFTIGHRPPGEPFEIRSGYTPQPLDLRQLRSPHRWRKRG